MLRILLKKNPGRRRIIALHITITGFHGAGGRGVRFCRSLSSYITQPLPIVSRTICGLESWLGGFVLWAINSTGGEGIGPHYTGGKAPAKLSFPSPKNATEHHQYIWHCTEGQKPKKENPSVQGICYLDIKKRGCMKVHRQQTIEKVTSLSLSLLKSTLPAKSSITAAASPFIYFPLPFSPILTPYQTLPCPCLCSG